VKRVFLCLLTVVIGGVLSGKEASKVGVSESFLADVEMLSEPEVVAVQKAQDQTLKSSTTVAEASAKGAAKKIKKSYSRLQQEAVEDIELLLHESCDLICSLTAVQKKYMDEMRRVAENDPRMTRAELESLVARTQKLSKEITCCLGNV